MINFALGNTSLFNTSHSTDILPGPVNKRLIHIAINSKVSSYPPTKPWDNPTTRVATIISITKMAAVILVTTPTSRNIPPITSNRPIGRASSGGRPNCWKKPWVTEIFSNFGNPAIINAIPARILISTAAIWKQTYFWRKRSNSKSGCLWILGIDRWCTLSVWAQSNFLNLCYYPFLFLNCLFESNLWGSNRCVSNLSHYKWHNLTSPMYCAKHTLYLSRLWAVRVMTSK